LRLTSYQKKEKKKKNQKNTAERKTPCVQRRHCDQGPRESNRNTISKKFLAQVRKYQKHDTRHW